MVSLRPYQNEAVNATLDHFRRQATPAVIVLPTGAGKSLVIAELARLARGRVLVLAHVKELVEQNHNKYQHYGLTAGIYSAGLDRKDCADKVIFGSIQSVARAPKDFFNEYSLLIIDECHRVSTESDTQYLQVIEKLRTTQSKIRILGLTATPYRMGLGWIYQYSYQGILRSQEDRFFKKCIFDLPLSYMIKNHYLTPPVKIDAPVAQYDFSSLFEKTKGRAFTSSNIEDLLKDQKRVTPVIVENIIDLSQDRQGVMIFSASVRHAQEIIALLPTDQSAIIVGETSTPERDLIIERFKARKIKFLVNVSVLTTGFDAPHVDVIAILRPTESVSLYQQIVGRGLRLSEGKQDCLVLDYTGCGHDIFKPEVGEEKPHQYTVPVTVPCPVCNYQNLFWGLVDHSGEIIEHFGRKCQGATEDPITYAIKPCGFRFRFKLCDRCQAENDIAARLCHKCKNVLVDDDKKLREAMALKDAYVMRPDEMILQESKDKKGNIRLEVRYYDLDGKHLSEYFYFDSTAGKQTFYYNFLRMHKRLPEKKVNVNSAKEAIRLQKLFRLPLFVIARKQKHYWIIREKIF
jgi:DNA repair protein RadD